jgi:hypothetical protein
MDSAVVESVLRDRSAVIEKLELTLLGIARLVFQDLLREATNSMNMDIGVWGVDEAEDFLSQSDRQIRKDCKFCQGLLCSGHCHHCERLCHDVPMSTKVDGWTE